MRVTKFLLAFGLICCCGQLGKADPRVDSRVDPSDPAHSTVMPTIDVSNQPVDKVLEQLRSSLPWFHYVIFRQTGAPKDEPKLPLMSLDGVTVEQFLKLITDEYPTVLINKLNGDKTPLYEVNISLPWKEAEAARAGAATEQVMKVFSLADIVSHMNGAGDPKKAMDDILSLVQAALDTSRADASGGDAKNQPVLKVHQPTMTLIFKGTSDKLAVLSQVLETLRPKQDEEIFKLQRELQDYQFKLDRAIQERDKAKLERDETIQRLPDSFKAGPATTKPAK